MPSNQFSTGRHHATSQSEDLHGPSEVVDPRAYRWSDDAWRGLPWQEAVVYELHVGSFTPEGTPRALIERLDYLVELGITSALTSRRCRDLVDYAPITRLKLSILELFFGAFQVQAEPKRREVRGVSL